MNLYLIKRRDTWKYDEYDSFVACCESVTEASFMHPDENTQWCDEENKWICKQLWSDDTWPVNPSNVLVTFLGNASPMMGKSVVCASFNAG